MDRTRTALRPTLVFLAVASCFAGGTALANPTGANVVRGTAAIHQAGNLLQITNSPNAIINWQSFSVGANEITRFLQQSPSSAVLNRVTTQNPSEILGSLQSKLLDGVTTGGRVFLINPNGILFGAGAQIDVGGLVASTLRMSDDDFLAGRMRFGDGLGKSVVNDGSIATGAGGSVYLIGSGVTNNGIIRSPQGEVILAAGNSVELVSPGTPNLRVEIAALDNEARNLGQIISDAGRIGIYAGLINNSGTIRADSAVSEGGRILLKASKGATLENTSVLSAQGRGGGEILVLADETTKVAGRLDASAPNGGDGGFIETSAAHVSVDPGTSVSAKAPFGKTGRWLIDPNDFTIAASGGDISGATISTILTDVGFTVISDNGGTVGTGSIFVNDAISWVTTHSLTFVAVGSVQVNKPITGPNGDVFLNSGTGVMQTSGGAITANHLYANGGTGSVLLDAASNRVNVLAGHATGSFSFTNGQSLVVGALPNQQNGIQVTGAGPASINVQTTSGDLLVSQQVSVFSNSGSSVMLSGATGVIVDGGGGGIGSVFATGGRDASGNGGHASIALNGGAGGINIINSAGVSAQGGEGGGGGSGGNAMVSLIAGTVSVTNGSLVQATGGGGAINGGQANIEVNAAQISVNSATIAAQGGAFNCDCFTPDVGGNAAITLNASGSMDLTNGATITSTGGFGNTVGGSASIALSGPSISVSASNVTVVGEDGNSGGTGGNASVNVTGGTIQISGGTVAAGGGGGFSGGNGGNASLLISAAGGLTVNGLVGAGGGNASSGPGNGGSAAVTLNGSNGITVGALVIAQGGSGNIGGAASVTANGGPGGIVVQSGGGGRVTIPVDAPPSQIKSQALAQATPSVGVVAVGGDGIAAGGTATAALNAAGGISVLGTVVGAAGGGATTGTGGNALATLTSGGNITLASNVIADGGLGMVGNGTGRIDLIFLNSGTDFVVNGQAGLIFDTVTGSGFMVNGAPAILNVNLFVTSGASAFIDPLVAAMNTQADVLADQLKAGETGEDKDKKKLPFCSS